MPFFIVLVKRHLTCLGLVFLFVPKQFLLSSVFKKQSRTDFPKIIAMNHSSTFFPFLLLFIIIGSYSTLPAQICMNNDAAGYSCQKVDLLGFIPISELRPGENGRGNEIWGWTDPLDNREYALVGLVNGTAFVDITDSANPVLLGNMASTEASISTWRDMKIYNNYMYVVSEASGHHVQVFDLTHLRNVPNPPLDFEPDATFNLASTIGNAHNIVINEETGYAYTVGTAGSGGCNGGPVFWDLNVNPLNPTHEGCYIDSGNEKYSHDGQAFIYRGPDTKFIGKEIYIGSNNDSYIITDVTDKNNPLKLSENTLDQPDNNKYIHQGWITDDHKYFVMNNELDEFRGEVATTHTYIIDITDLNNPFLKWTFVSDQSSIDHNLYVKGSYVYQSNYTSGLRILDISDLDNSNAVEVAYFDTYPDDDAVNFNGTWGNYPFFKSGNVVVNDRDNGLFIVEPQIQNFVMSIEIGEGIKELCRGDNVSYEIDLTAYGGLDGTADGMVNFQIENIPSGVTISGIDSPVDPDGALTLMVSTHISTRPDNYNLMLEGAIGNEHQHRISLGLKVMNDIYVPQLLSPSDNSTNVSVGPDLEWEEVGGAVTYTLEVARDEEFVDMFEAVSGITTTSYQVTDLDVSETYYWRVTSNTPCADVASTTYNFSTINMLSVNWIDFRAIPQKEAILLQWETSDEVNNKGFEIQRRAAYTSSFEKIGWVNSLNNEDNHKRYEFVDSDVKIGQLYYYRLVQEDLDGSTNKSKVVNAIIRETDKPFWLYPNPAKDWLFVEILNTALPNRPADNLEIKIMDITGKTVWESYYSMDVGNRIEIPIDFLPQGVYSLQIKNGGEVETLRFVKKK